jgi:hypothetical protein
MFPWWKKTSALATWLRPAQQKLCSAGNKNDMPVSTGAYKQSLPGTTTVPQMQCTSLCTCTQGE